MTIFPGPFQVHAWKKQNKTHFRNQLPNANITIHKKKKKKAWRKHENQKTSFSFEMLLFFFKLSDVVEENQSPVQKTRHNMVYKHAEKQQMG